LAAALVAGTAGCTFLTQQATLIQYDPSDGVGGNVGDVKILNAVALIGDDGQAVSLLVTIVNEGDQSVNLNIQYLSGTEKTTTVKNLSRNSVTALGSAIGEEQLVVLSPGVKAGGLMPVYFQYGDHEGTQLLVPVLEATGQYEGLQPPPILR
jgi:hypothetical protein